MCPFSHRTGNHIPTSGSGTDQRGVLGSAGEWAGRQWTQQRAESEGGDDWKEEPTVDLL